MTKEPRAFTITGSCDCIKNTNFSIVGNFRKFGCHLVTSIIPPSGLHFVCIHRFVDIMYLVLNFSTGGAEPFLIILADDLTEVL